MTTENQEWDIYLGGDLVATTDDPEVAEEFRDFEGMYRVTENKEVEEQ